MRVVVALGEDGLLKCGNKRPETVVGQRLDASARRQNITAAARSLADLADRHELVIIHGNGPQVGSLVLRSTDEPPLGGVMGYWLHQALQDALPGRQVVALVNQTLVSRADPAFTDPATFVGPVYSADRAAKLAEENGWTVRRHGDGWRRVVPSPHPLQVVETGLIRMLLRGQAVVVCAGGVPVIRDDTGGLAGVEAIIDRDLTGSVLAEALDADAFLILTSVLRAPQVEAARGFAERTGGIAAIGRLDQCVRLLEGTARTAASPGLAS